uniref:Uncharacterized protein n=1 Tax=viral metagenome TaxID=1070528 RepID=A0A6C0CAT2_9ZZZZ
MSLGIPENIATVINPSNMDSRVKETLDAWLKYGTVALIFRLGTYYFLDDENAELFDTNSLKILLFILIGFTVYYMVIKPYIPINLEHPVLQNVASDTLMFGTVLVSSHVLDVAFGDEELFSMEWLNSSAIILVAFAVYQVLVHPFVPTDKLSPRVQPIVDDWLKFGVFLVAARFLQGRSFNQEWILSVICVLLGFAAYHLVTKKLIE